MLKGKNLFLENSSIIFSERNSYFRKPCIFLSHKSEDKEFVDAVADYIMNCGINIYYDKYDQKLANAIKNINAEEVTSAIEDGISKSTHLLCVVSEKTVYSWWVPYEVGYAKKSGTTKIATLIHKNTSLPQFLKITEMLKGISDLDKYLIGINGMLNESNSLYSRNYSFASSELGKYLDR